MPRSGWISHTCRMPRGVLLPSACPTAPGTLTRLPWHADPPLATLARLYHAGPPLCPNRPLHSGASGIRPITPTSAVLNTPSPVELRSSLLTSTHDRYSCAPAPALAQGDSISAGAFISSACATSKAFVAGDPLASVHAPRPATIYYAGRCSRCALKPSGRRCRR